MSVKFVREQIRRIIGQYLYCKAPKVILREGQQQSNNYAQVRYNQDGSRSLPALDRYLRSYFNRNKYIGSGQRSSIADKVYNLVKYQYLLAYLTKTTPFDIMKSYHYNKQIEDTIDYKLELLNTSDFFGAMENPKLPKYLRASQNKLLFRQLSYSLMEEDEIIDHSRVMNDGKKRYQLGNEEAAYSLSKIMNERAPLTLRINPLKTDKHSFIDRIEKKYDIRLHTCEYAPFGMKILQSKNVSLLQTDEFSKGMFQIQDEGSQLAAMRVRCKPGDLVLDYCGGSGGKSLAIAHLLQGKGQIFIHEPREVALQKAKKRFDRAGIQNVQYHSDESKLDKIILKKADWVIVDAPCTGTGTLRRNPDIKLKFNEDYIKKQTILQQQIFGNAMKYLRRSAESRIVYITCSLMRQQNEELVKRLLKLHDLQIDNQQVMKIMPQKNGMDGFFAVVLKRR